MPEWILPDHIVELTKEQIEDTYRQAIIDIKYGLEVEGHIPSDEEVMCNHSQEVQRRRSHYEQKIRQGRKWKSKDIQPELYKAPSSLEEVKNMVMSGDTYFENAILKGVDISNFPGEVEFNFNNSLFENCSFDKGRFRRSTFRNAKFINCNGLESADFSDADFKGAVFNGENHFSNTAIINGASFEGADLRDVKGISFDNNFIYRMRFPKDTSADIWSNLRKKYSGFALFINSILLLLFIAPFVTKIVSVVSYGRVLSEWNEARVWLQYNLPENAINEIKAILEKENIAWSECGKAQCEKHYAIYVALTAIGKEWWYRSAVILAAIMFVFRYIMTTKISSFREHEDRAYYTPPRSEYMSLYSYDKLLSVLQWPLYVFYGYVIISYALTEIIVPA